MRNDAEIKEMKQEIRRLGVMLEHMDSKIDILVEGFSMLDRKLDRYHDELGERISRIEATTS